MIGILKQITIGIVFLLLFRNDMFSAEIPANTSNIDTFISTSENAFEYVTINSINIEGNKKSKPQFITRFLGFKVGDSIPTIGLKNLIETAEKSIYNTGNYNSVNITFETVFGKYVVVTIVVKERLYYIPMPVFKIVASNFNTWWVNENRDPNRIIYGLEYKQKNVRGRGEEFELGFNMGYNQQFWFEYEFPFINKKQTVGLNFEIEYERSREVNYITVNNKSENFKNNQFQIKTWELVTEAFIRKGLYREHIIGMEFYRNSTSDTICKLNSRFFLDSKSSQQFFKFNYTYKIDRRDRKAYPLDGYHFKVLFEKYGLGIFKDVNYGNLEVTYDLYQPLGKKFYMSQRFKLKTSFPYRQPYNTQEGLGHEEYLRGYEYYVIDGQHYAMTKINFKRELFQGAIAKRGKIIKGDKFSNLPVASYIKAFVDLGYVSDRYHNYNNELNNKFLLGWGVGFDWPIFYDITIRTEYSWNRYYDNGRTYLQQGFYLHFSVDLD